MRPVLLAADNFAPAARTPWGGWRLSRGVKSAWLGGAERLIGESWEVSIEPDFPGRLADGGTLLDYLLSEPAASLGDEHTRGRRGTALLVKLLDADEALSVQIHPSDDYARLAPDEAGKPESWYVVAREPGAGLYLGFERGVREADVRSALETGASLVPLLRFVPVEPGDFFVIEAGTPHAIGPGLTLVEPQHVLPGKRGLTYRYWDWNRRYDAAGKADPAGTPRALHVDDALAVTAWERVTSDAFVDAIRLRGGPALTAGTARAEPLAGPGGLDSEFLRVARITGTGALPLPFAGRLRGVTVLAGSVSLGDVLVEAGRSAVAPASFGEGHATLTDAHAVVTAIA
jgi:Phosphomannose isomerase type I